jgi:hypothetical protein
VDHRKHRLVKPVNDERDRDAINPVETLLVGPILEDWGARLTCQVGKIDARLSRRP